MRRFSNPSEAYLEVLRDVILNPDFEASPRGKAVKEKIHYQFTVENPSSGPIVTQDAARNEVIAKYTKAEFDVYAKGSTSVEDFGRISKFWLNLGNPDGTVNSAYGHLIFFDRSCGNPFYEVKPKPSDPPGVVSTPFDSAMRTPWEWARLALLSDKDTRQAVIKFHRRDHLWVGNKDMTCTLSGTFLIRDDRLHLIVHMRSNDVVKGLVYDMPWFCYLIERMTQELKENAYPNLRVGTYTHFVDSLHVYDSDHQKCWDMLGGVPTL
jgi:thymidylate synthase